MTHNENATETPINRRRSRTDAARTSQVVAAAYDLAEERILNKTASSAEIVHFLRLGSPKEQLEIKKLQNEVELLKVKTESLQNQQNSEKLYADAIAAMKDYQGKSYNGDEEEDYSGYM